MEGNRPSKRNKRSIAATISAGLFSLALGSCDLEPPKEKLPQYTGTKTKIAFSESNYTSGDQEIDIWTINSDGTDLRKIADDTGSWVKFSPDGKLLAFYQDKKINVMDLEGNKLYEVENVGSTNWAPDGKSLITGIYKEGVYKHDLETGVRTQITYDGWKDYLNPQMSPNMEKLFYWYPSFTSISQIYHQDYYIIEKNLTSGENWINQGEKLNTNRISASWIDDTHFIWGVEKGMGEEINYCNENTQEIKKINTEARFYDLELSPNKKIMSWRVDNKLKTINTEDLDSTEIKINDDKIDGGSNFTWSPNGDYFILSKGSGDDLRRDELRIYDKQNNKYHLLWENEFPDKGACNIERVDWSTHNLE